MPKLQHGTVLRKSGSWVGRYSRWLVDHVTGEKIRQQKSFVIGSVDRITKSEARRALRTRIEQELGLRSDSRVTVQWFIENRWKPLRESTWRDSTKVTNGYMLAIVNARFGTTALEDTDAVALQRFLDECAKTRSGSVVRHIRTLLKSIFQEAADTDYVRKSPARLLRIPLLKPTTKPYLSVEQIQKLLSAAKGRDHVLLSVLCVTALRPSELLALRYGSLDAEQGLLNITESVYRGVVRPFTKTTDETSRKELTQVFLPQEVVTELLAFKKLEDGYDTDFIFTSGAMNKPILKENYVKRNLNPLVCRTFHDGSCARTGTKCKGAGVPLVNFQVIRRSCSTHMQNLGSLRSTSAVLRHSKVQTAQDHYVQVDQSSVREVVGKLAAMLLPSDEPRT